MRSFCAGAGLIRCRDRMSLALVSNATGGGGRGLGASTSALRHRFGRATSGCSRFICPFVHDPEARTACEGSPSLEPPPAVARVAIINPPPQLTDLQVHRSSMKSTFQNRACTAQP